MTRQTDRSETPCKHGEIATYPGRGVQCQKCGRWAAFASRPEREAAGLRAALERLVNISTLVWKRIADDPDYRGPYYETCELDDALSVARVALWITKHDDPHAS